MMRRLFKLPTSARRAQRDVDAELRFHMAERIEELVDGGAPRDVAERQARTAFGDWDRYRRETRELDEHMIRERRRMDHLDALRRELRLAFRSLTRSRLFATVAIVTLALGIRAPTTLFTLLDRL